MSIIYVTYHLLEPYIHTPLVIGIRRPPSYRYVPVCLKTLETPEWYFAVSSGFLMPQIFLLLVLKSHERLSIHLECPVTLSWRDGKRAKDFRLIESVPIIRCFVGCCVTEYTETIENVGKSCMGIRFADYVRNNGYYSRMLTAGCGKCFVFFAMLSTAPGFLARTEKRAKRQLSKCGTSRIAT